MRTTLYVLLTLAFLAAIIAPRSRIQAAPLQPAFQYAETLTANGTHKMPSAAVGNGQVHVAWASTNEANYGARAETAQGFVVANPPIGSNGGNSTYYNHAITSDKNNLVHSVWINGGGTLQHRSNSNGTWSGTNTVATGQNFANNVTAGTSSTGRIFAAWRHQGANPDGHIAFSFSDNAGASWSTPTQVQLPAGTYAGLPRFAGGPNGQMFLTWTGVDGNVYVGEFNGTTFVPTKITSGSNFFNSTISVAPNGQPYAAWRNSDNGVFYGFRSAAGTWTVEKVFPHGGVTGPAVIVVDSQNNIHLAWISQQAGTGSFEAWYSIKAPNEAWTTPFVVSRDGTAFKANLNMAVSLGNGSALAHIFWESFAGGQFIRYAQVKTPVTPPLSGTLLIDDGAAFTKQAAVNVKITNTSTAAATVYSVADGKDPGTPTISFTNPSLSTSFNLDVADGQCRVHTVYGKLGTGSDTSAAFADTIIYDPSAQVDAQARNPNWPFNQPLNRIGSASVPTGDVAYTREQRFNLSVVAPAAECSGLKRYALVAKGAPMPTTGSPEWVDVPAEGYVSANIQFVASAGQGTYQWDVYAEDKVGHLTTTASTVQVLYDTTPPTVSGTRTGLATTASPKGGRGTITISTRTVDDNMFAGFSSTQKYWGYWVVVKRTADGAPSDSEWDTYGVIEQGMLGDTLTWNMAKGMVKTFQPNTEYTVHIRYLDGAGNGSAALSSQAVLVKQLEYYVFLPLARR